MGLVGFNKYGMVTIWPEVNIGQGNARDIVVMKDRLLLMIVTLRTDFICLYQSKLSLTTNGHYIW